MTIQSHLLGAILCAGSVVGCSDRKADVTTLPISARIDQSLAAGAQFLVAQQSNDGAWRSDVYGNFRDGDCLTPLALSALLTMPSLQDCESCQKGWDFLADFAFARSGGALDSDPLAINYPVYTASQAVVTLGKSNNARHRKAGAAWLSLLRQHQLTEELGWHPSDSSYGGWGFSGLPTRKAASLNVVQANLSATVFAVDALRSAFTPCDDPAIKKALVFIQRCQNYSAETGSPDSSFADGGFFFSVEDGTRNKAGSEMVGGQERFRSYGATSADGWRGLMACGLARDHARSLAAQSWLEKEFVADKHAGTYSPERAAPRDALYYYYCRSAALAFHVAGRPTLRTSHGEVSWPDILAEALVSRQKLDGSWCNPLAFQREDDPLVATSFALTVLSLCRTMLDQP